MKPLEDGGGEESPTSGLRTHTGRFGTSRPGRREVGVETTRGRDPRRLDPFTTKEGRER